jgi:hypothetical protein
MCIRNTIYEIDHLATGFTNTRQLKIYWTRDWIAQRKRKYPSKNYPCIKISGELTITN